MTKNTSYTRRDFLQDSSKSLASVFALGAMGSLAVGGLANANEDSAKSSKNNAKLPQRILGNSGISISAMGLGCMGMTYALGVPKPKNEMIKLIHKALDLGVSFFDTAEVYGPHTSEEYVGEAFSQSSLRQRAVIATKFGVHYRIVDSSNKPKQVVDSNLKGIRDSIEGSLKRLRTDYIDLYYQHRVDPNVPIEEVASLMATFQKEGKIRTWGLSEPGLESIKRANAILPLSAVQNDFSMWYRGSERFFETFRELNIALVPFSPLGKGYLAGALKPNHSFGKGDLRPNFPRYSKENLTKNQEILDFIAQIAKEKKVNGKQATLAQIALAWILAQGDFIIPIPGTTQLAHLEENLEALQIDFSADEMRQINARLEQIKIYGERYAPGSDMAKRVGQ